LFVKIRDTLCTWPITADNHDPEVVDLLRLSEEPRSPVDYVELANAVDHGRVASFRLQVGELEGERLLDAHLLLDNGNGVITVLSFVQTANL